MVIATKQRLSRHNKYVMGSFGTIVFILLFRNCQKKRGKYNQVIQM